MQWGQAPAQYHKGKVRSPGERATHGRPGGSTPVGHLRRAQALKTAVGRRVCHNSPPFGISSELIMPIPDYQTLMLPLFKRAAVGELRVLDAEKQLGDEFNLTPDERDQLLPSGKQRVLHNRAHWAKFYMMKAGLVSFPKRGTFVATDAGRALLATNPTHVDLDLLRQYPSFEEFYRGDHAAGGQPTPAEILSSAQSGTQATPEEQIEKAFVTLQSALRTDLLDRILQNTPGFFEELIIDLLVKMGYGGSRPDAATNSAGPVTAGLMASLMKIGLASIASMSRLNDTLKITSLDARQCKLLWVV